MLNLQGTGRVQKIVGRKKDGSIEVVQDLLCARKHVIDNNWKHIKRAKKLFAFVSSPKIYNQKRMRKKVQAWCHVFENPQKFLPKKVPSILLPESDFIDSSLLRYASPPIESYAYDYFYFTINARSGIENKGLSTFIDILPALSRHKLRGLVIVYFPNSGKSKNFVVPLSRTQKGILRTYKKYVKYHWGILDERGMDRCMSQCRFGLFPNTVDNSPRIISECLSRNTPILVNKKIHGGWHYVSKQTGALFTIKDIEKKIEFMLNNKFNPREYYESNFGFDRSSQRLASFLNPIFDYSYTHMCFKAFKARLKQV